MDLLKLRATLGLDASEYEEGLNESKEKASSFGSKIGSALGTGLKVIGAGLAAASSAVAVFTKGAVDNFAQYEQLVGGVETLFKGSSDKVQQYADQAYTTAGLSANEYMETVTSFSASLLQSLSGDTEQAADMADLAIRDMSDNANKMGSNMESIQNAYQGFAKQNYTMLDNLKLGYGGTKEEMQRLINDANDLKVAQGEAADLTIDSYANVVEAIHLVQENMGITGTTAKEAGETITGSLASVKSAWKNLSTAIGTGDSNKISQAISQLAQSASAFAKNLLPTIKNALKGVSQFIAELGPVIAKELPKLIKDIAPALLESGAKILQTLAEGIIDTIPELMPAVTQTVVGLVAMFVELLPQLVDAGVQALVEFANGITQALPDLIPTVFNVISAINTTLLDNADKLIEAAIQFVSTLVTGMIDEIPKRVQEIPQVISKIVTILSNNAGKLLEAATSIINALVNALTGDSGVLRIITTEVPKVITKIVNTLSSNVDGLVDAAVDIIKKLTTEFLNEDNLETILQAALGIISSIVDGISKNLSKLVDGAVKIIDALVGYFLNPRNLTTLIDGALDIILELVNGITKNLPELVNGAIKIITSLVNYFSNPENIQTLVGGAIDILVKLADGLIDNVGELVSAAVDIVGNLVTYIIDKENLKKIWDAGVALAKALVKGMISHFMPGQTALAEQLSEITDGLSQYITKNGIDLSGLDVNLGYGLHVSGDKVAGWIDETSGTIQEWSGVEQKPIVNKPKTVVTGGTSLGGMSYMMEHGAGSQDRKGGGIASSRVESDAAPVKMTDDYESLIRDIHDYVRNIGDTLSKNITDALNQILANAVAIVPNEDGIFEIVQAKNDEYLRAHGVGAFV